MRYRYEALMVSGDLGSDTRDLEYCMMLLISCVLVPIYYHLHFAFPDSSVGKKSTHNAGDYGLIPGLGRAPGEGKVYPLRYYGLETFLDCIVHGVAKSQS